MKKNINILVILSLLVSLISAANLSAQDDSELNEELFYAVSDGDLEKARIAVIEGAKVNSKTYDGITPLMYAVEKGNLKMVEFLVKAGAKLNIKPYYSNRTALMAAVENAYVQIAEFLIIRGAKMDVKDYRNYTLMHKAAISGVWEMCDLLLYYGMPVDPTDDEKQTPLMLTSYYGFDAIARVLIQNDANVNQQDTFDNTALHMAAQNGYPEVVKELIDAGAKTEIKNEKGFTPLDMAVMYGRYETSKILIDNGAEINNEISPAVNQLTLAKKSGNRKLKKLLIKNGAVKNKEPLINGAGGGTFLISTNNHSYIAGLLSVHEDKLNIDIDLFYGGNSREQQVSLYPAPGSEYRIPEKRKFTGLGITKNFPLFTTVSNWRYGLSAGIQQYFTWAEYTAYRPDPSDEFMTSFQFNLLLNYDFFNLNIGYQYLEMPINNYNPHHFYLGAKFYLKFRETTYYNIKL